MNIEFETIKDTLDNDQRKSIYYAGQAESGQRRSWKEWRKLDRLMQADAKNADKPKPELPQTNIKFRLSFIRDLSFQPHKGIRNGEAYAAYRTAQRTGDYVSDCLANVKELNAPLMAMRVRVYMDYLTRYDKISVSDLRRGLRYALEHMSDKELLEIAFVSSTIPAERLI